MNEDVEGRLRRGLHEAPLPSAPTALRDYVVELRASPEEPRRKGSLRAWIMLAPVAAVLVVLGVVAIGSPTPLSTEATPTSGTVAEESAITVVDGLPIVTVSELLAARGAGEAVGGPFALRGFWTVRPKGFHGCGFPMEGGEPGDLELWCLDGEWGITERDEPIARVSKGGLGGSRRMPAEGPHLTPWIASDEDMTRLRDLPVDWPPVPIIVLGHFDDPLAEKCRTSARQECLDRFVVDRVVSFEPSAARATGPEPTATPFPIEKPPPPPFGDQAWDGACYGDVDRSFEGWTKLRDLDIALNSDWDPETYVYAIVTSDVVPIGDPTVIGEDTWHESPDYPGHEIRWWGRRVCFAQEPGSLYSKSILGTTFIEVDDGRRIEAPYPFD